MYVDPKKFTQIKPGVWKEIATGKTMGNREAMAGSRPPIQTNNTTGAGAGTTTTPGNTGYQPINTVESGPATVAQPGGGGTPGSWMNPTDPNNGALTENMGQGLAAGSAAYNSQKYEDAAYAGLTRGMADNKAKDLEAKKQELQNRGVPYGSPEYLDEIKSVNTQYDTQDLAAHNQSYLTGQAGQQFNQQLGATYAGLGQQGQQFGQQMAYNYANMGQQNNQFNAGQANNNNQFNANMANNNNQFNAGQQFNYSQLGQQGTQFGQTLAEQQAARAQQGTQFGQTLKQNQSQFGQNLALQRAALAKRGSGGGGGSAASSDPVFS